MRVDGRHPPFGFGNLGLWPETLKRLDLGGDLRAQGVGNEIVAATAVAADRRPRAEARARGATGLQGYAAAPLPLVWGRRPPRMDSQRIVDEKP